jgi:hypothetical protein
MRIEIMDHDNVVVLTQMHINLHGISPALPRQVNCCQRVFWRIVRLSAMGDDERLIDFGHLHCLFPQ